MVTRRLCRRPDPPGAEPRDAPVSPPHQLVVPRHFRIRPARLHGFRQIQPHLVRPVEHVLQKSGPQRQAELHRHRGDDGSGPRGHRNPGRGEDRGIHLEEPARSGRVHELRPLSGRLPRLHERRAAQPQKADPGHESAPERGGPGGARRKRRSGREAAPVRRACGQSGCPGRRTLGLPHLRGLPAGMPRLHRAHPQNGGHAPLPGDDGIEDERGRAPIPEIHGRAPPPLGGARSTTARNGTRAST